ncbi:MAG TPA: hypothetical protein VF039_05550 [Longimicrobiales bacterium]
MVPRLRIEGRGRVWADVRGLDARRCVEGLSACLSAAGWDEVGAGVSALPVTAAVAAVTSLGRGLDAPSPTLIYVPVGGEREWLASHPLSVLEPEDGLLALLGGVGIERCGELAALPREAVEVRFGVAGVALWKLARGEEERALFGKPAGERPGGSIDFVDYVVTDPARLLFTANALLTPVCEQLQARGHHARRLRLRLGLANGQEWRRSLRAARPTASRERWLGMIRGELERLTVPDAVAAVHLEVESTEEAEARQGDLFDRGFATANAVESALARLIEEQGPVVVAPSVLGHPLAERRTEWTDFEEPTVERPASSVTWGRPESINARSSTLDAAPPHAAPAALTLQLHPEPQPVEVDAAPRRDHELPTRYRERRGGWRALVDAAGPDRRSGGQWEGGYAREYFRCVTEEGALVWLFREPREQRWYLHGWWE